MESPLSLRQQLTTSEGISFKERYRARLVAADEVPILCHLQSIIGSHVIIIDSPKAEGYEAQMQIIEGKRASSETNADKEEMDKENIPVNCTLVGDPLKVSFLTLEKLDKMAASKSSDITRSYETFFSTERYAFNTHLIPAKEAFDIAQNLSNSSLLGDSTLANTTRCVLADASSSKNFLFGGYQKTKQLISSFHATYIGNLKSATTKLQQMDLYLQRNFEFRHGTCRSRFDVLEDFLSFKRAPDFVAASFIIQAEWPFEMPKNKSHKLNCIEFLEMPPITAKRFKPGWLDERIELTERIEELGLLKGFALALNAGEVPLKKDDEDPSLCLQRVNDLIENAKSGKDTDLVVHPRDFTDRLWNVVKIAHSIRTVQKCFQLIYDELQKGDFRVLVESTKVSSLAKMLRIRNTANIVFNRLEPLTCVQMLVEIGVDCFQGDLCHRFVDMKFLPNSADLAAFFAPQNASLEARIEKMIPIYLALQSIIKMDEFLKFDSLSERTAMTKRLLVHFSNSTKPWSKEFSFETMMEQIDQKKLKGKMSEWIVHKVLDRPAVVNATTNSGGGLHDVVHISKGIGFKFHALKSAVAEPAKSNGEMEHMNSPVKSPNKSDLNELLYDCVHVSASSHPTNLFSST